MLDWLPELNLLGGWAVLVLIGWACWWHLGRLDRDEWQRSVREHEDRTRATRPRPLP